MRLARSGFADIVATNVEVGANGTSLGAVFDLSEQMQGTWNVVVTNTAGASVILADGFTVEAGRAPQVSVEIVGFNLIRPMRSQSFQLFYSNQGNVDALVVPVWLAGIPANAVLEFTSEISDPPPLDPPFDRSAIPQYIQVEDQLVVPLIVSRIPPGQTEAVSFRVTIPGTVNRFTLRAWANPPLFSSPLSPNFVDCIEGIFGLAGLIPGLDCVLTFANPIVDLIGGIRRGRVWWMTKWLSDLVRNCLPLDRISDIIELIRFLVNTILGVSAPFSSCTAAFQELRPAEFPVDTIASFDPNDKVGSRGGGSARLVSGREPLRYSILFENLPTATAAAQEVTIHDQLDLNLDLSTLALGPVLFGNHYVVPPPNAKTFAADVDLRPANDLIVRATADLNPATGLLTWHLRGIDPATGDLPADPRVGFLPPNTDPPEGDGSVLFSVMPKQGLPTGTTIRNSASITFDVNAPISTPEWLNTLDNAIPSSRISPLPAQTGPTFTVQWSGTDMGSGIQDFTVYTSDNGAAFRPWLTNTTATQHTYTGIAGHTYGFYTIARDLAGNVEGVKFTAEATVTVAPQDPAPRPPRSR